MDRKEFFEWLLTCPTHKWEIISDNFDYIRINFPIEENKDVDSV